MSEGNGSVLCAAERVSFKDAEGNLILDADLVDVMIGVYESSKTKADRHECLQPFAAYLQKHFGVLVATSQAEIIYCDVSEKYKVFKKKLAGQSKSDTASESIQELLTVE